MGIGIKRLFKKKKDETTSTPTKTKEAPGTPPTERIKENSPELVQDGTRTGQEDSPSERVLDSEAISNNLTSGCESVLGDLEVARDDAPSKQISLEIQPTDEDVDAPIVPRRLDLEDPDTLPVEKVSRSSSDHSPSTGQNSNSLERNDGAPKVDSALIAATSETEKLPEIDRTTVAHKVTSTFLGMIERATQCAGDIMMPDKGTWSSDKIIPASMQKLLPTVENACLPVIGLRPRNLDASQSPLVRQYSYYDDEFALKMLDELANVGYALVHHHQLEAQEEDDEGDWVGRSVTLLLRPGICNRMQVQAPYLEWATLGGGLKNVVESSTLSLLDIHSVATCTAEDMELRAASVNDKAEKKSPAGDLAEQEDLHCLFSITTKQGKIFMMEAITADESQRLVAGVKNLASRLSRQLIAGDDNVLTDFFDNSQEPDEIRLSQNEAMHRIAHALLDYLSRA